MCGVLGVISNCFDGMTEHAFRSALNLLSHRGPDGEGIWEKTMCGGRYKLVLGHRRLSIIDIDGGAQPMHSHDRLYTITFNGEIYNYVELRSELEAHGHAFATISDTEVVIESYRAWGIKCVEHFR